jgi:drug/metabolite transporter (DMT)-like permease
MNNKPIIALIISVISASFAAIFIVSTNAPSLSIAFYRLLFTTLILFPILFLSEKIRNEILNLPKKTILIMIGIGLILATHFAFWITSLKFTSIASSVILVTAHPILVAPIAHFLFKERMNLINLIGIIFSISGVIILIYGNYGLLSFTLDTIEGNIMAIIGGIAAGLYILGGRRIRKSVSIITYAIFVYSIGALTLLIICIFFKSPIYGLNNIDYLIILLMAIISGIFGHTLYNWSLEYVRASLASVMLLGEPLFSTLFAFLLPWISQLPSLYTMIGGGIIIIGIYMTSRYNIN